MELNLDSREMQKWNIPKDRPRRHRTQIERTLEVQFTSFVFGGTQRLDEKNGVIYSVIMFTSGVVVIKLSKMDQKCIFFWWQQKSVTVWGI